MPAAWTLEHVAEILHAGDKVLIPVLSSPNDIKACIRFIMSLDRTGIMGSGIQLGLITNRIKSRTHYSTVLMTFFSSLTCHW